MWWDIGIMLVAFAAQCANTYVGWSVTKSPINPSEKSRILRSEIVVWSSFVIGAIAIVALGVRGRSAQDQLDRIEAGENKPHALKMRAFEAVQNFTLAYSPVKGKPVAVSVSQVNANMGIAHGVVVVSRSYLYEGDQLSITSEIENNFFGRFEDETKNIDKTHGHDVAATQQDFFTTKQFQPLTEKEASDILGGREIVFEMGQIVFSDDYGSHMTEFCRWLQYPIRQNIWHICRDHNGLKGEPNP